MTFILAIDQGTSGTKAIVVDEAAAARSLAEVALSPRYLEGGGVEQDPEALFDSVARGRPPCGRRGGGVDHRGGAGQPGRDGAGLGPSDRPTPLGGRRVAGPPRGGGL